jgi:TRAP-type uncharacterized transport system fused permease subunit
MVGEPMQIVHDVATAFFAVWMLASALESWLVGIGRIAWASRLLLGIAAFGMLTPGVYSDLIGGGLLALVYGGNTLMRRRASA